MGLIFSLQMRKLSPESLEGVGTQSQMTQAWPSEAGTCHLSRQIVLSLGAAGPAGNMLAQA